MYVVGTAGHVDHGKSTLVKILTGIDPDRWEEEQRREMTIDLGFAWLKLPSGQTVSIIDVPGHERFIKNMLAGVGGIDAALFIVAADESVMPQTQEHLAILDLLDVAHGVVVLTKADLVDDDWLSLVQDDVRSRLSGTVLANAPIVPVSARSGRGITELLATLEQVLSQTPSRSVANGIPRLPIDRSFTIGGFGAVVTGTLIDGPLTIGDEVEILPKGLRARVRGLQLHQQRTEIALPGSRVAVNLAGVSHHDLVRGDVLTLPGRVRPTDVIDARLRLASGVPPIEQNDRLELFVGACEVPCRVTLLDTEILGPGQSGWVQIRLERPIAVVRGDRYILRQPSPSQTLGGGRIADTHPARHRRFRPDVIAMLEALARGTPADLIQQVLSDGMPHHQTELARTTGLSDTLLHEGLDELHARGEIVVRAEWQMNTKAWAILNDKIRQALAGYHRRYPLRSGMPREELRSRLKLNAEALDVLLEMADVIVQGTLIRAIDHVPTPNAQQAREIRLLLDGCARTPYSPPIPELEPELLGLLIEQGQLVKVSADVVFLPESYREMVAWVRQQIDSAGSVTVAQFRDRFQTSRKYALALMEHLDERKVTRRVGDARVIY